MSDMTHVDRNGVTWEINKQAVWFANVPPEYVRAGNLDEQFAAATREDVVDWIDRYAARNPLTKPGGAELAKKPSTTPFGTRLALGVGVTAVLGALGYAAVRWLEKRGWI